jgi:phenylpyruvate tautomerase PptA (4-oxalocrotonate tautomerase family)
MLGSELTVAVMPFVSIELRQGVTTPEQRKAISDAIVSAMIEVLAIPADDRFHVFHELPDGDMFHESVAFGKPRTDRLMFITLSFNHRTPDVKSALFASLVRHLRDTAGVPSEDVVFRILETARENWWADGRVVNPETGYDERMTPAR